MSDPAAWQAAWTNRHFRWHAGVTLVLLAGLISFLPIFFQQVIGPKPGIGLNDFVLAHLPPTDWSVLIFVLIYGSVIFVIVSNRHKPFRLLLGLESYALINLFRVLTLYVCTLEPPTGLVPLIDPLVDKFAYGGTFFTKDLFFSGHTATLFLLFLVEEQKVKKLILLAATTTVAFLLLWQHVHYTIDVLAAPPVTFAIYRIVGRMVIPAP